MNLTRIYLESFGKYNNKEIKFSSGINLIYGTNEKGKSTLFSFIEAMLYGLNHYRYNSPDRIEEYFHYRPWKNKDLFSGELDLIENEQYLHMKRNFLSEKGMQVFLNDSYLPSYHELKESQESQVLDQRQNGLSVLGITDISNKTGNSLVNEMKSRILNIRSANSGIISLQDTLLQLKKRIEALENNPNYFQLTKQLEYYNEKCRESENLQSMKKDFIESYYRKYDEMIRLQHDISKLKENIKGSEQLETLKKYKLIIEKNEKIRDTKVELALLAPYVKVSLDQVEVYINAVEKVPKLKEEIHNLEEAIENARLQQDRITLDISPKSIEVLSNDEFNIAFIGKFQELLKIKNELFDIEQGIYTNEEKLLETEDMNILSSQEAQSKGEKLDKDYFKFMNMVSWKNQIQEEQENDSREKAIDEGLKKLDNKSLTFRSLMLFFQIISALSVLATFAKPSQAKYLIIGIVLGIVGASFFKIKEAKAKQEAIDQKYIMKNLDDEILKNKGRLQKANANIGEILALYKCETEEAFHQYYKEKKLAYENEVLYRKELDSHKEKKNLIVSELMNEEHTVSDYFDAAHLFEAEKAELDKKTYDKVLYYIKASKKYNTIEGLIEGYVMQLAQVNHDLKKIEEILANELFRTLDVSSINDYQEKREEWIRVNESLSTLEAQKEMLLAGEDENTIVRVGQDLMKMEALNNEDLQYNLERLKELVLAKEEKLIQVRRECTDAKYEAEKIANSQVAHSRIREKIDEINGKIRVYQEEISLYTETYELIETASLSIGSKFHDELKLTIQQVVEDVIGDTYEVLLEDDMKLLVKDKSSGEIVPIEDLSMGTIDQIYFALRIGLIHSMDQNLNVPLILDDCFVHYDGGRLEQMLLQIANLDRQIILLTCHERERQIFEQLGIPIHYVEL